MPPSVLVQRPAHDVAQGALVLGRERRPAAGAPRSRRSARRSRTSAPRSVTTSIFTRRSCVALRRSTRPRSSRRSTIPVTFELSQCSASARSLIGTGRPGSSTPSARTCGGESSNSEAMARNRRRRGVEQLVHQRPGLAGRRRPAARRARRRHRASHGTYMATIVESLNRMGRRRVMSDGRPLRPARRSYAEARVNGNARVLDPAALGDHVDRLYRAAWALCGSREDAEDLVQDTFARVLAKPRADPQRRRSRLSAARAAQHVREPPPRAARRPATTRDARPVRAGRPQRRLAAGRGGRRARGLRAHLALPESSATRSSPSTSSGSRTREAAAGAGHARGHDHEPPLSRTSAGRSRDGTAPRRRPVDQAMAGIRPPTIGRPAVERELAERGRALIAAAVARDVGAARAARAHRARPRARAPGRAAALARARRRRSRPWPRRPSRRSSISLGGTSSPERPRDRRARRQGPGAARAEARHCEHGAAADEDRGPAVPGLEPASSGGASGARRDKIEGRDATTVYYDNPRGARAAYTILGGAAIKPPDGRADRARARDRLPRHEPRRPADRRLEPRRPHVRDERAGGRPGGAPARPRRLGRRRQRPVLMPCSGPAARERDRPRARRATAAADLDAAALRTCSPVAAAPRAGHRRGARPRRSALPRRRLPPHATVAGRRPRG